jgi:2,3-bisphosphoglycerate-dependent phosphoglycerate mutase
MEKGLKIYVFRHGQTFFNKNKIFTGWKDSKLTPLGFRQARIVALKLRKKKIEVAFHTSLSRSKDTLKEVLKFHLECRELIEANHMIERSYGDLSGFSHKSIIEKYGEKKFNEWHRSWNVRPPKGECFADVEKRVKVFIKDLKDFMKKEKVNVAISAHGNSIRLFRKIMEGLSIKETCELYIPYDKVFEYSVKV